MARRGERATHCKNGHAYTPENTRLVPRKGRPTPTYQRCKQCERTRRLAWSGWMREYHLNYRYGITKQERSRLLIEQDGLCALCADRPATEVDHDHVTGRVRGILCRRCNIALGALGDTEEALASVLEYLRAPRLEAVV